MASLDPLAHPSPLHTRPTRLPLDKIAWSPYNSGMNDNTNPNTPTSPNTLDAFDDSDIFAAAVDGCEKWLRDTIESRAEDIVSDTDDGYERDAVIGETADSIATYYRDVLRIILGAEPYEVDEALGHGPQSAYDLARTIVAGRLQRATHRLTTP